MQLDKLILKANSMSKEDSCHGKITNIILHQPDEDTIAELKALKKGQHINHIELRDKESDGYEDLTYHRHVFEVVGVFEDERPYKNVFMLVLLNSMGSFRAVSE